MNGWSLDTLALLFGSQCSLSFVGCKTLTATAVVSSSCASSSLILGYIAAMHMCVKRAKTSLPLRECIGRRHRRQLLKMREVLSIATQHNCDTDGHIMAVHVVHLANL